eukprot:4281990-Pyramimonas_sp.AAC.1
MGLATHEWGKPSTTLVAPHTRHYAETIRAMCAESLQGTWCNTQSASCVAQHMRCKLCGLSYAAQATTCKLDCAI